MSPCNATAIAVAKRIGVARSLQHEEKKKQGIRVAAENWRESALVKLTRLPFPIFPYRKESLKYAKQNPPFPNGKEMVGGRQKHTPPRRQLFTDEARNTGRLKWHCKWHFLHGHQLELHVRPPILPFTRTEQNQSKGTKWRVWNLSNALQEVWWIRKAGSSIFIHQHILSREGESRQADCRKFF